MDDTAAIRERLGKIGALTEAGVERPELLREVRGLLEEGERTVRQGRSGTDGPSVEPSDGGRSDRREQVRARRPRPGGEATVS